MKWYEAQVDYYTQYIQSHADWAFVKVYTDMKTPSLILPHCNDDYINEGVFETSATAETI